jgi:hypothetical protein
MSSMGSSMGNMSSMGGSRPSPFGSNPMQTRPWMQPGYGKSSMPQTGGNDYTTGAQLPSWWTRPPDQAQTGGQDYANPGPDAAQYPPPGAPPNPPPPGINPATSFRFNPTSGQDTPFFNFPGMNGGMDSSMPAPYQPTPMTGGQNYVTGGMDPFGGAKPAPYMPTGGMDPMRPMFDPSTDMPGGATKFPQTGGQNFQQAQAPQQSWEQQNSQLIRPQQMQDPGMLAQQKAGAQSNLPGLTPQQLAMVNQIGANPVGGGAALNNYLLSIGYPGALQPGQLTIR